jgi:hypothetical protein
MKESWRENLKNVNETEKGEVVNRKKEGKKRDKVIER